MKHIGTALIIGSLLVSACGSRPDDSENGSTPILGSNGQVISGTPTTGSSVGLSVRAISNTNFIETGGSDSAIITALITDINNLAVAGQAVAFSATGGVLQEVATETDANGEATALLKLKQSYANQQITVTVLSGTATSVVNVSATGSKAEIAGPTSLVLGDSTDLTMTLTDGKDQPIINEPVTFTSAVGNAIVASSPTTDSEGRIIITVNSNLGDDEITASALGGTVIGKHTITVAQDILAFTQPEKGAEVAVGTVKTVDVEWQSQNAPVAGQQLRFGITAGQIISNSLVTTDASGRASVQVTSSSAGPATVSVAAADDGDPTTQLGIEFVATTPNSVDVSSSASRVPTQDTATITALVADVNGNPVKNQEVVFSSADLKGGQLNPASALTNSEGQASVTFTAGNLATEFDEIEIVSEVAGSISGGTRLTVVERVLNVTLGTSGILDLIANEAQYGLPFAVQVADGGGTPLENATVEISIRPVRYFKGDFAITLNETSGQSRWTQRVTATCETEDDNGNRQLDPGEDNNNNNVLDPQDPAVVASHLTAVPTVEGGTIVTNSNGSGYFTMVYPASSASWSEVDITARAKALGVEAEETFHARLWGSAERFANLNISPPNETSPFGESANCTDEL